MNKYYEKLQLSPKLPGYHLDFKTTDSYLRTLTLILDDGAITPSRIKNKIIGETANRIAGNLLDLILYDQYVSIGTCFDDEDNEIDRIKISKEKLIKFIDDWQNATKDNPDEITLYRDDDYNIWLETSKT